ncbi:hypothetical protein L9H26_12060 [Morganella psychrotolerans]|uniref:hypothetical protein n=1 Tax=Morganella psychrotolerans TaxID=368603 RepID=UPI0007FD4846|nr:hypothetical protein [Morganella psychrotolerans]OBU05529.1 hypothetical protein AYY16_09820 [Morganella psychrotolerans]
MNLACVFNRQNLYTLLLTGVLTGAVIPDAFSVPRKAGDENRLKINISGTVVATGRCVFRNHGSPDIDFGDIRFSSASGVNNISGSYVRPLDTDMTCTGDTAGTTYFRLDTINNGPIGDNGRKSLPVKVGGIMATDPNLAIRLLVNGKQQDINTNFTIDTLNLPKLEVELVQIHPDDISWVNGQKISSEAILTMSFD